MRTSLILSTLLLSGVLFASSDPSSILPNGKRFEFWETNAKPIKTYHVAQKAPNASDFNDGSEKAPWKTVSRAARQLQPGERVLIHAGVYREWVKPKRGGTSPDRMITYEGVSGEEVIITGNEVITPEWSKTKYLKPLPKVTTWQFTVPSHIFERGNTFCLQNFPVQDDDKLWPNFAESSLRRGSVYANGVKLTQVCNYKFLAHQAASFWVEDDGVTIHLRAPGDRDPREFTWEVTARQQVFAPMNFYCNYIRVKGIKLMHAANGVPIPQPQMGLLSTSLGHHWIIENCTIKYANTIGIDCGTKWWGDCSYTLAEVYGYHIIRNNHFDQCGLSAISSWFEKANRGVLVEDNLVENCAHLKVAQHCENGGIKMHYIVDSLFRRNIILNSGNTASIWLDAYPQNNRITQNVFYNDVNSDFGSIFIEITPGPNLIDNNLILTCSKRAFYEHDASRNVVVNNLMANGKEMAVFLNNGDPGRVMGGNGKDVYEDDQRLCGNIMTGFNDLIRIPHVNAWSDYNLFGDTRADKNKLFQLNERGKKTVNMSFEQWQKRNMDRNSQFIKMKVEFDPKTFTLRCWSDKPLPTFKAVPVIPAMESKDYIFEDNQFLKPTYRKAEPIAPLENLLLTDFFGKRRDSKVYVPGPFVNPKLDGTPFSVDPRKKY